VLGSTGAARRAASTAIRPLFIKLYCEGPNFQKNQEQCTSLNKIQCDIHRLKAEKTVELADRGGAQALRLYEQAGNDYIQIWRTYGDEPLKAKQPVLCEKLEAVLYNAARAFQAGRLVAKAIQARLILINPANNMDKTDVAKKAVYEIGGNYQAIAVYDEAANWYERYAKENPKGENAASALSDATLLRLGLGQEEEAIKDGDAYNKAFGNTKAATSAAIAFGIGAHYADNENWDKAKTRLSGAMNLIEKSATFDVVVQAHGLLARAYTSLKRAKDARVEYAKVQKYWSDAKAAESKIMSLPDEDEAGKIRRLGRALTSVGEAYFYFAEEKREEVEKIKFPEYKGPGRKRTSQAHQGAGPRLDEEEATRHRGGDARVQEDRRSAAGASAALGHRGRLASGRLVGQLRAGVPRGAHPHRHQEGHRAPQRLLRRARRGFRAGQVEGQGSLRDLSRLLGQIPVLRRVLA
jgi:hypothetical protein